MLRAVAAAPHPLLVFDAEARLAFANDAALAAPGRRRRARSTQRVDDDWALSYSGEEVTPSGMAAAVLRQGRGTQGLRGSVEREGRLHEFSVTCVPVRDAAGAVTGVLWLARDVATRHRRSRERLRLYRTELLARTTGGLAHYYNNFLTVILGNLSLARQELRPDCSGVSELLEAAEEAAMAARGLTRRLSLFRMRTVPDASAAVEESVSEACASALAGLKTRCVTSLPAGLPKVALSAEEFTRVLEELLKNAAEAMLGGGIVRVEARPRTRGSAPDSLLELSISDEGRGIARSALSSIFDPFSGGSPRGRGLGLAICEGILSRRGAGIDVFSEPGKGTTVLLTLPLSQGKADRARAVCASPARILLMDDDQAVLEVAARILRTFGHMVETAADGLQALEIVRSSKEPFDLAILDVNVDEGLGGVEAGKRMLALQPSLRVVLASGYASSDVLLEDGGGIFRGFIAKPYRAAELCESVKEALAGWEEVG